MAIHIRPILFLILFITFVTINVTATKKRVHIPDDLHDVKDSEEDEAWIEWGQKKRMTIEEFDLPPENFSDLDFTQMQEEVMKREVGQSYGFVKLRLTDDPRTPSDWKLEFMVSGLDNQKVRLRMVVAAMESLEKTLNFKIENGEDTSNRKKKQKRNKNKNKSREEESEIAEVYKKSEEEEESGRKKMKMTEEHCEDASDRKKKRKRNINKNKSREEVSEVVQLKNESEEEDLTEKKRKMTEDYNA
ncbi:hypothetical protein Tco_1427300 [Tanacetum coccineum]